MLLYKVASFVVIDFENGVDYISFSVFDFSALKNGTEYSFVNDQFQVNDYTDVTLIKDKSGTAYTEATLDAFITTIKVISDPSGGGLPIGGTTGQILAKIDGTDYNAEWIDNLLDEVNPICKLDENISKGQAVYISGADGTNKVIKKASNTTELTSSKTFGLLSETGVTNNKIRVITLGYLSGLDTSSANEGDPVWLGVNGNLIYGIANKPHAPEHLVFIGFVVRKSNVNGQIYVRVQNGFELNEIHDVKIESPANKNTLFYNSSNSLWENRLIGITDVTNLESALSGKVDGSGTTNFISKFTASGTIGNSLIYDDGTSAGIGTTVLQSKFHVHHNSGIRVSADSNSDYRGLSFGAQNNDSTEYSFIKWCPNNGEFKISANISGFGGFMSFYSNESEAMRITAEGNVGIGITNPLYKLQVIGRIQTFQAGIESELYDGINSAGTADQFLSSQGSYIEWKSLKTVNGNSLIGSGNITISGGSGLQGVHSVIPLSSGDKTNVNLVPSASTSGNTVIADRLIAYPYIPNQNIKTSDLQISVNTAVAGSLCRIAIYSDLNGKPNTRLYVSANIDCSTPGIKTLTTSFNFVAGTIYWLAFHNNSGTSSSFTHIPVGSVMVIRASNIGNMANHFYPSVTVTFASGTPATFPTSMVAASANIPYIGITKA